MTTKEKIRGVTHLPYGLRHLVLGIVATLTITLSVSAQSFASFPGGGGSPPPPLLAAAPKGAKCAILDQGLVTCPAGVKANACYYKDLGNPDPKGSVNGFVEAPSCDNGIFKAAETPQITASEDPALTQCKSASSCDLVKKYVDPLINVLAAAVGVVVTISIVVGGIQYASSAGDPGKAQAARKRIMNAIIALIGFFLFYAVLQWLVPGGLLNG
jgi:hypothetical protein